MGIQVVPFIITILSIAATAYASMNQYHAAQEAEDIAERNAQRIREETAYQVKVAEKKSKKVEGLARARAFASGLGGKSHDVYLSELSATNQEEIDWIMKSGASRADIEMRRGAMAAKQAKANLVSSTIQGVGSTYSFWNKYGGSMDYSSIMHIPTLPVVQ